jgi:hypothetical protein
LTTSSARARSAGSSFFADLGGWEAIAWARETRTVFSARWMRSFPSRERIRYFASLEWSWDGSLEAEQDARSFFMIPIFFCWDYLVSLIWDGDTDWPVVEAISLRDLKTPGTVSGDGLNIVG